MTTETKHTAGPCRAGKGRREMTAIDKAMGVWK